MQIVNCLIIITDNTHLARILMETCEPKNDTSGKLYQDSVIGALLSLSVLSETMPPQNEFFNYPMDQVCIFTIMPVFL